MNFCFWLLSGVLLISNSTLAAGTKAPAVESSGGYELKREREYSFPVDRGLMSASRKAIQYFYLVLNEDKSIHSDAVVRPESNPIESALKLDTSQALSTHLAETDHEMNDLYIIVGKMAYVLNQDVSLFQNRNQMLNPKFLLAMNPEYSRFESTSTSEDGRFRMVAPSLLGVSYLPDADLKVTHFSDLSSKPDEIKDIGAKKVLGEDLELGTPNALVIYQFDHFTNAAAGMAKASQGSFSYLKFYSAGKGKTLVVENILVYVYHLVPGGPESMRKSALKHIPPKAKALEAFRSE